MRPLPVKRRRCRGTTLIEMAAVISTMTVVLGGALVLLKGTRDAWALAGAESRMQESGRHILAQVLTDLRRTGLSNAGGQNYPAIWEHARGPESTPRGPLLATMNYADAALVSEIYAVQGDGVSRIERNAGRVSDEIAFQLARDQDGDGTPLDGAGNLEWSPEVVSYRVVDDPQGRPWLVRFVEQGGVLVERRPVGPDVVAVTFDVVLGDRTVRFNEVAIVLYLRGLDLKGRVVTTSVEGSIVLRNTQEQ